MVKVGNIGRKINEQRKAQKFSKKCIINEIVPKGLTLKLEMNVGNCIELRSSIEKLLKQVGLELCEKITHHLNKAQNLN